MLKEAQPKPRPGLVGPLYHGTRREFVGFELPESIGRAGLGLHFGTLRQAENRAYWPNLDPRRPESREPGGENIHPVYLKASNPLRLPDLGEWQPERLSRELLKRHVINEQEYDALRLGEIVTERPEETASNTTKAYWLIRGLIEDAGYDSVVYRNRHEGSGDSYIVWHLNQIVPAYAEKAAGSKVAQPKPRPGLVGPVYHGTMRSFGQFRLPEDLEASPGLGIHFGTLEQAENAVGANAPGSNVRPAYLKIKNALRLPDLGSWSPQGVAQELVERKVMTRRQGRRAEGMLEEADPLRFVRCYRLLREAMEAGGYDAVIYGNRHEGSGDSYIVWRQEQVVPAYSEERAAGLVRLASPFLAAARVRYYHGSTKPLRIGTVLMPGKGGGLQSAPIMKTHEGLFEQAKPSDKISRMKCVFMCDSPQDVLRAGGGAYVYEVQPLGQVDKSDQAWYGIAGWPETGMQHSLQDPDTFDVVMNYWQGVPYPDPREHLWEYRTLAAKVLRQVKIS